MELLAPAGDMPCLEAAVEAGADAVYLGLSLLNARRAAKNFTPAELERAVTLARAAGVAVHLTMNTDVSRRETGAAARILALARDIGVTAIIARDWAVVGLWRTMFDAARRDGLPCPALHLSTQTAVTNAEGALLARDIGAARVVLARELSLAEIGAIRTDAPGLEIEVFAQGALCYSISGRCLLSSWGGGRSGNRGLCASPCRVPWAVDGDAVGTAMSMRDLVTVDRLAELTAAGVDAIKIEGRLKKPDWVREAVSLYRAALGPRRGQAQSASASAPASVPAPARQDAGEAVIRARRLAAYAGRETTSAYLDGRYSGLTGLAARKSSRAAREAIDEFLDEIPTGGGRTGGSGRSGDANAEEGGYSLEITVTDSGLSCRCRLGTKSERWRMPKTRIRREKKAVSIAELFARLRSAPEGGAKLVTDYTNEPDFMLPPRNVKAVIAAVAGFISRLTGRADDGADAVLKAPLPAEMRAAVAAPEPDAANIRRLGEAPNMARVSVRQLNSSLLPALRGADIALQQAGLQDMEFARKFVEPDEFMVSLPEVYFPAESAQVLGLAEYCRANGIRIEANCWGSVQLCRRLGLRFTAGPGLPVLNHLAVKCLRDLGAVGATVSVEADRQQIEDLCAAAALPLTLIVYARPVLAYTRIAPAELLPPGAARADGAWTDRRGISLSPEARGGVTVFRSLTAFDWGTLVNERVRVANLAVDLSGESLPVDVWKRFLRPGGRRGFLFNYDRGLK